MQCVIQGAVWHPNGWGSAILPKNVLFIGAWRSNFPTFEVGNPDDGDH